MGQKNHDWNAQGKGRNIKIGNDRPLAEYIEGKIIEDKYSPEAALAAYSRKRNRVYYFYQRKNIIQTYIDKGIFLKLTNKDLPVKGKRKSTIKGLGCKRERPQGKA